MTARLSTTASTLILLGGLTATTAALAGTPPGADLTAAGPIVRAQAAAPPPAAAPAPTAASGTVTVRTIHAHVRAEPTTKSAIVGDVKQGTKLQVVGSSGDWTQVQVGDKTGYVNNNLLTRKH